MLLEGVFGVRPPARCKDAHQGNMSCCSQEDGMQVYLIEVVLCGDSACQRPSEFPSKSPEGTWRPLFFGGGLYFPQRKCARRTHFPVVLEICGSYCPCFDRGSWPIGYEWDDDLATCTTGSRRIVRGDPARRCRAQPAEGS